MFVIHSYLLNMKRSHLHNFYS